MKFVLEFASDKIDPVIRSVERMILGWPFRTRVVSAEDEMVGDDEETTRPLPELFEDLRSGKLASVGVESTDSTGRFALLHRPHFTGHRLPLWYGTIDTLDNYASARVSLIKDIAGLKYAAVLAEDTFDVGSFDSLTKANYPWDHWRLIEAAIAEEDGDLRMEDVRHGPAFSETL